MRVFTYKDYVRMYRARGLGFCWSYFWQAHFYDLVRGVDTHTRNDIVDYVGKPSDFDHGIWYVCSRTDLIRRVLRMVKDMLGDSFADYQFCDLVQNQETF